jgi:polyhydroxybutyrate depolymerase
MKRYTLIISLMMLVIGLGTTYAQQNVPLLPGSLVYEDVNRSYQVFVPTVYDDDTPLPVVVALHGRDQGASNMAETTDLTALGEEMGFFVVFPNAINGQWNYVRNVPFYDQEGSLVVDDTGFLLAVLEDMGTLFEIDRTRVYALGLSNGGFMTHRLACEAPDTFAAFASIAATAFGGLDTLCEETANVPMMIVHGTEDPIVPWEGAVVENPDGEGSLPVSLSASETALFWAEHNGCSTEFSSQDLPSNGLSPKTRVRLITADDCDEGGAFQFFVVLGGGHTWPGIRWEGSEATVGRTNLDISASRAAWSFFQEFALESAN